MGRPSIAVLAIMILVLLSNAFSDADQDVDNDAMEPSNPAEVTLRRQVRDTRKVGSKGGRGGDGKGKGGSNSDSGSDSSEGKGKSGSHSDSGSDSGKGKGKGGSNPDSGSDSSEGKGKGGRHSDSGSDSGEGKGKGGSHSDSGSDSGEGKGKGGSNSDSGSDSGEGKGKGGSNSDSGSDSGKGKGKSGSNSDSDSSEGKGKGRRNSDSGSDSGEGKDSKPCIAFGDPHFSNIDGSPNFTCSGICEYKFAADTKGTFAIYVKTTPSTRHPGKTVIQVIDIHIGDQLYSLSPTAVTVNSDPHPLDSFTDYKAKAIKIVKKGQSITINCKAGKMEVTWGHRRLMLWVKSKYFGQMEGLCGNNNGNADDDLVTSQGETAQSIQAFCDSWVKDQSCLT